MKPLRRSRSTEGSDGVLMALMALMALTENLRPFKVAAEQRPLLRAPSGKGHDLVTYIGCR
jgi:hypothetical protein